MSSGLWRTVANATDLPDGGRLVVPLGDAQVALFRSGARVFAIEDRCPHQDAPLHDGLLEGSKITCRWHGWCFEMDPAKVREGIMPGIDRYEARLQGDAVQVSRARPTRG